MQQCPTCVFVLVLVFVLRGLERTEGFKHRRVLFADGVVFGSVTLCQRLKQLHLLHSPAAAAAIWSARKRGFRVPLQQKQCNAHTWKETHGFVLQLFDGVHAQQIHCVGSAGVECLLDTATSNWRLVCACV